MTDDALLQALARTDPDFAAFAEHQAALAREPLPAAAAEGLAADTLAALRADPDQSVRLQRLAAAPAPFTAPERFDAAAVPLLLAVVFLLRTHLRIRRHKDGSWDLQIEHKPGDSKLVTDLLKRLSALLPGSPGGD